MKQYKLLIFDWDGTLMDSAAHISACLRFAIEQVGLAERSETALRHVIGLGLLEALAQLYPHHKRDVYEQLAQYFRDAYLNSPANTCQLFAGVPELLAALSDAGYELALATGKSRRGLDKAFKESGMGHYFPVTRCADETFSKPNPLMLEEILVDYDRTAEDALMIGDTHYDLQMATNAGMDALAVSYGVHPIKLLKQYKPVDIVHNVIEIGSWCEKNNSNLK